MLDISFIRKNPELVLRSMKDRGLDFDVEGVLLIDDERTRCAAELQTLQSKKNTIAEQVAKIKRTGQKDGLAELIEEGDLIGNMIKIAQEKLECFDTKMNSILASVPNILDAAVPFGEDECSNMLCRSHGEKPIFEFNPKKHFEVLSPNLMDFEVATKISGARFVVLRAGLASLERALKNFMLDIHTKEFGYTETSVPYLVNKDSVYGTGHLPNFEEDMFVTENGMYLISTAEVALTNVVRGEMLREDVLPIRMTAFSSCFRLEAGAAGRDTRGMVRQHQFQKVELVSVVLPENSDSELEKMCFAAETILKRLGLHYRVMLLCSGDTGFCSKKTYDIEVWLPGEGKYREISSCSNVGDFQARRMSTRVKRKDGKKEPVHTLNGSGLAIGRTIVAILENYQRSDGSVKIPDALLPYMGGSTQIG